MLYCLSQLLTKITNSTLLFVVSLLVCLHLLVLNTSFVLLLLIPSVVYPLFNRFLDLFFFLLLLFIANFTIIVDIVIIITNSTTSFRITFIAYVVVVVVIGIRR